MPTPEHELGCIGAPDPVAPNPIVVAFDAREDRRNVFALRQWVGFLNHWDDSIVAASAVQITEARVVLGGLLDAHPDRDIAI